MPAGARCTGDLAGGPHRIGGDAGAQGWHPDGVDRGRGVARQRVAAALANPVHAGAGAFAVHAGRLVEQQGYRLQRFDAGTREQLDALVAELGLIPMTGFYSNGEISPTGFAACALHNQTMTLTTLQEV